MNEKLYKICALCLLFTIVFMQHLLAQAAIEGPACVVAHKEYQYSFSGNWNDTEIVKICVQGGSISGATDTCQQGQGLRSVRIIWNDSVPAYVSITAGQSNARITVITTEMLNGGVIDSAYSTQVVKPNSIPATIICSDATGGNCSPGYDYQWQLSTDQITWDDIAGSTLKNMEFNAALAQHQYYRRKVTEKGSGSVSYSTVAAIYVLP